MTTQSDLNNTFLSDAQKIAQLLKTLNIGELRAIEDYAQLLRMKMQETERLKLMEAV